MTVWEYISATTIMEIDKESRAQKQTIKKKKPAKKGEEFWIKLIICMVVWIISILIFAK